MKRKLNPEYIAKIPKKLWQSWAKIFRRKTFRSIANWWLSRWNKEPKEAVIPNTPKLKLN